MTSLEKLILEKIKNKTIYEITISLKKSLIFQKNFNFPPIEEIRENFKIYKKTKNKDYFLSLWAYIAKMDISNAFPIKNGKTVLEKYLLEKILIHSERKKVWLSFSGINQNKKIYQNYYQNLQISKISPQLRQFIKQINKDIKRTFSSKKENYLKIKKLENILKRYAKRNVNLGYTQGLNLIVKYLLEMDLSEEEIFWFLTNLIENLLPKNYYQDLSFVNIDIEICLELLRVRNFDFYNFCEKNFIPLKIFLTEYFITLFCCVDNLYLVSIIFDYLLLEGVIAIYRSVIILLSFFYGETTDDNILRNFKKNFLDFLNNFGQYKKLKACFNKLYINRKIVLKIREILINEKLGFLLNGDCDSKIVLICDDFINNLNIYHFNPVDVNSNIANDSYTINNTKSFFGKKKNFKSFVKSRRETDLGRNKSFKKLVDKKNFNNKNNLRKFENEIFDLSKSSIYLKHDESDLFQFGGNLQNQIEIENKKKENKRLKNIFFENSKIITETCYKKNRKKNKNEKIFIENNKYYLREINISKSYLKASKNHRSESFEKFGTKKLKRIFSKSLEYKKKFYLEDFLNISLFSNQYKK